MNSQSLLVRGTLPRRLAGSAARIAARAAGSAAAGRAAPPLPRYGRISSFATASAPPPSDDSNSRKEKRPAWSGTLTFTSPEADFTAQADVAMARRALSDPTRREGGGRDGGERKAWSGTLSFESPESDFTAPTESEISQGVARAYGKENFIDHVMDSEHYRPTMAYGISFASADNDWASPHVLDLLDERQRRQLAISEEQGRKNRYEVAEYDKHRELLDERPLREKSMAMAEDAAQSERGEAFHFEDVYRRVDSRPLPRTYREATGPSESRPVVVTEASPPFRVVSVNEPWEGLCGYTLEESRGRTLGSLLQGPETDTAAATSLIDKLLHGEEAGTVLTNYAKDGRKFQNRLRAGALKDERGERVTHFVGVLREIHENADRFKDGEQGKKSTNMA